MVVFNTLNEANNLLMANGVAAGQDSWVFKSFETDWARQKSEICAEIAQRHPQILLRLADCTAN